MATITMEQIDEITIIPTSKVAKISGHDSEGAFIEGRKDRPRRLSEDRNRTCKADYI